MQRILRAGEAAEKKNLKIAAGLMCRHSSARQALIQKIRDGAMGADPAHPRLPHGCRPRHGPAIPERRERAALADPPTRTSSSGSPAGVFIELMIHQIDECCWIKDAWPVCGARRRRAVRRQHRLQPEPRLLLDRVHLRRRHQGPGRPAATSPTATTISPPSSTAPSAPRSSPATSTRPPSSIYKDQRIDADNIAWKAEARAVNPWQAEWNVLLGRHPQRPAAQRGQARGLVEPRRPSWAGRPSTRARSSPGTRRWPPTSGSARRGRADRRQPGAGPGRRPGPLSGAGARRVDGNLILSPAGRGMKSGPLSRRERVRVRAGPQPVEPGVRRQRSVLGVGHQTRRFPISGDRLASLGTVVAQPEAGRARFLSDPEPDDGRSGETSFQRTKRAA